MRHGNEARYRVAREFSAVAEEEKVRRLVRRLRVPASDSDVWLGILRQIVWKCGQANSVDQR